MESHKDIQLLIIPDVHGRDFWKEALLDNPDVPAVFLGDYVDPYPNEGIDNMQALDNFQEILQTVKTRPGKTYMLLGNHDIAYLDSRIVCSRHNYFEEEIIHQKLVESEESFCMAYEQVIAGKRFLFTHAGVSVGWIAEHKELFGGLPINAGLFNTMFWSDRLHHYFMDALSDVSAARGGTSRYGSMIWADAQELMIPFQSIPDVIQVFGHTQQKVQATVLKDRSYCLDWRRPFYIDCCGEIRDYCSDDRI